MVLVFAGEDVGVGAWFSVVLIGEGIGACLSFVLVLVGKVWCWGLVAQWSIV